MSITSKLFITSIDSVIKDQGIDPIKMTGSKVKQLMKKVCSQYNTDIFDISNIKEYHNILDYYSDKYKFNYRRKKTNQPVVKFQYQNRSKEFILIGSKNSKKYMLDPMEMIIQWIEKDENKASLFFNSQMFKVTKDKWREIKSQLYFIDEIRVKDITINF